MNGGAFDGALRCVRQPRQACWKHADVQCDLLSDLDSRMVIPLRKLAHFPKVNLPTRLTPIITILGEAYLLETPKMAAVPHAS